MEIYEKRSERIEKMHREKVERITKSTALKCAVDVISSMSNRLSMSDVENGVIIINLAKRFEKYLVSGE